MTKDFDILIIGGGFSGLTSALAIAMSNSNLKIALLEKNDIINHDKQRDGRTFAISKSSLELFAEIGIEKELEKNSGHILDIKITDGNSPFYLYFEGSEVNHKSPILGLVIENFHIHNALRDQALKQKNIEILSPNFYEHIEFEANEVVVTLNDQSIIKAKLLIAADGRFSALRDRFHIRTFEKSYHQAAIVFDINHTKHHHNIAQEKFLPEGPFAILPMQDSYKSSIVWTVKESMADVIMVLDEENFLHELKKRTTDYLGEISMGNKPFKYQLSLILADKYYYQRMVLVGDAAHGIHPIAGQGFNVGIEDIKLLKNLIKENFEAGLDIASVTMLEQYQKARKIGAGKMVLATDSLNYLFSNKNLALKLARNIGLAAVEKLPKLKKFFIKNAGGSL